MGKFQTTARTAQTQQEKVREGKMYVCIGPKWTQKPGGVRRSRLVLGVAVTGGALERQVRKKGGQMVVLSGELEHRTSEGKVWVELL